MIKTHSTIVDNNTIEEVWNLCSEAYLSNGFKLTLPKNTRPQNTYQWRYASAIAKKFNEWEFDTDTAKRFIDIAVKYSKSAGTMCKGLAALHQGNMLDICYKKFVNDGKNFSQTINTLSNVQSWINQKIGDLDLYETLIKRQRRDSFCNLTLWYQASRITPLFMSLSRSCLRAISTITDDYERIILPKLTTLFIIRSTFIEEVNNRQQAKNILGHDFLGK